MEQERVAILAGNSRVGFDSLGDVVVEAQLGAFRAGLARAVALRERTGTLPPVSVAFDHRGVFARQFLTSGLTHSERRRPRLSQVRAEVASVFAPVAVALAVPLDHVQVHHEDSARTHVAHLVATGVVPDGLRAWVSVVGDVDDGDSDRKHAPRATCAAIGGEYYLRSLGDGNVLESFFEDAPWSRPATCIRAASLTRALGHMQEIRLILVDGDGGVVGASRAR